MPVSLLTSCFRAAIPFSTRSASGRSEEPRLRAYTELMRLLLAEVLIMVSRRMLTALSVLFWVSKVNSKMVSVPPLTTSWPATRKV